MAKGKVYENQALLLEFDVKQVVTAPTVVEVHHQDPAGAEGTPWIGAVKQQKIVFYQIPKDILTPANGIWKFTAFVEKGNISAFSETIEIFVHSKFD